MTLQIDGTGAVAEQLAAFAHKLSEQGAWFHPSLVISSDGNELSMISREAFSERRSLLRVPLALMPMSEDFDWMVETAEGAPQLVATPGQDVSDTHRGMMAAMVDLYNATDKLRHWQQNSPWAALRDHPEVLAVLFEGRCHTPKAQGFYRLFQQGEHDALLVKSFLGSRVFNLSAENRQKAGHGQVTEGAPVLMPVIDYFNHRFTAKGFSVHDVPSPVSMRVFGQPDPETGELFVRYNAYDPLDTYLFYGFVDTAAPWLSSVPLSLTVNGRTLSVEAKGGTVKGKLAPALRDLRLFMPQITHQDELGITLNKLVIPGPRAPRALQRVLAPFVARLGVAQAEMPEAIARLEESILAHNEAYWARLANSAQPLGDDHPVHALCQHARAHLADYRQFRPGLIARAHGLGS